MIHTFEISSEKPFEARNGEKRERSERGQPDERDRLGDTSR